MQPWTNNYIDTKAKCRYLKKLTCKGNLRQVSESQNLIPPPPPPYALYLFTQGRGDESWTIEKGREATQESTDFKAGLKKIPTWLNVHKKLATFSLEYKHLPQSPFAGHFLDDDILHCLLWVLSFYACNTKCWNLRHSHFKSSTGF